MRQQKEAAGEISDAPVHLVAVANTLLTSVDRIVFHAVKGGRRYSHLPVSGISRIADTYSGLKGWGFPATFARGLTKFMSLCQKFGIDEKDFQTLTGLNILKIILDKRTQFHLLLNTGGGQAQTIKDFFSIANCFFSGSDIERSNMYVANNAQSTGAILYSFPAGRRYATPESHLMHHRPVREKPAESEEEESRWQEKGFFYFARLFLIGVKPEKRNGISQLFLQAFDDPSNPEGRVQFTGGQLHELGVVTHPVQDIAELRAVFAKNVGMAVPKADLENPLSRFFLFAKIEKEILAETGKRIFILDDGGEKFRIGSEPPLTTREEEQMGQLIGKKLRRMCNFTDT